MRTPATRTMSAAQRQVLLRAVQARFEGNRDRHPDVAWTTILARLEAHPDQLWSLGEMERTGGEPDVVGRDPKTGACLFMDCSAESPAGRRSTCYDRAGLESRKEHRPDGNAVDLAAAMGIELLSVEQYHDLQRLGPFDRKTSSWLTTPPEVRHLGGALFGDYRYGRVFVYHNGAQSYYAARGFRGALRV